ncbi:DUF7220 family protein [Collimonas pratensis]|uniref:DUF7220 family protein n=1 Tax=Collimonas pratensis TaxID=279113 RepID=UPI003B8A7693
MSQSRRGSLVESVSNVFIGYGINFALNLALFPLFGWHISLHQNFVLGTIYTVVSLVRSYVIRRFFSNNEWRQA